jgi:5-(carboxyamino)imidazole ribonucleotide synthase
MLALAAAELGLKTHIYCESDAEPAVEVAGRASFGGYLDAERIAAFAQAVDVVTIEFENIPVSALEVAARHVPAYPPPASLGRTQDRLIEKQFVASLGIPVARFAAVEHADALGAALAAIGTPAFLKSRRFGYDGKGQVRLEADADPLAAMAAIGGVPAVLEGHVPFLFEVSVIGVCSRDGTFASYDIPRNRHAEGILRESIVPAGLPAHAEAQARDFARRIAQGLGHVGVLGVEMFWCGVDASEPLIVNEIAPRVHNSGHWTQDACAVSQFENHMRAVAGWPLGSTERHSDAVMQNLIGEEAAAWQSLAAESGACLHLYGKKDMRPGRKMGHVTRLRPRR